MNSSLALYDTSPSPGQDPMEEVIEKTITEKKALSLSESDFGHGGIGSEMHGEEGGGVKSAEVQVFLAELEKQQGVVVIGDDGQSMGLKFRIQLDRENLKQRRGLSDRLYMGVAIPGIVAGLDDGRYNAARLGNIIKRKAR